MRFEFSPPSWLAALTVGVPNVGLVWGVVDLWQRGPQALELALLATFYVACAFGTETGFHRLVAHRSFQVGFTAQAVLCVLGSMAVQGPPLFWAAVHRQHHAKTDRPQDPHSPYSHRPMKGRLLLGLLHAHVGWLFVPTAEPWTPQVSDLLRDRTLRRINALYPLWVALGIALPAAIGMLVVGTLEAALGAALWGGLVRIALWQHATWSVNSLGHAFGARPFRTKDQSRNNLWLILPTLGGAWHNNHHAFPSSARVGLGRWQPDLHYLLIRSLEILGLAWAVKVPSPSRLSVLHDEKEQDDGDTIHN